ncbi:helix-turn-helix domain-containing protein [Streptomyces sp. NPDC001840]
MSNTTTDRTRTLHAVPNPEPLAGLTGAPATIYSELVSLTDPTTAAELALATGLGRSTAGKALTTLEQHGLAVRTPGNHDGARRTPDRWRATPTQETNSSDTPRTQEPASVAVEPATTDSTEPVNSSTDHESITANETEPNTPVTPEDDGKNAVTVPTTEAPKDAPLQGAENGDDNDGAAEGNDAPEDGKASAPLATPGEQTAPAEVITLPSGKNRLAPGGLRQMVIDHLQAHPGEAFTATKISRVIERSSGAIANALVTLTKQGIAEQVSDRPRTYRLASAKSDTE